MIRCNSCKSFLVLFALSVVAIVPSYGHEQTTPWLQGTALDRGVYVEVRHPRVLRNPGAFDVSVVVNNVAGAGDVVVTGLRYDLPTPYETVVHERPQRLATKRNAYRQYKSTRRLLRYFAERRDREAVKTLMGLDRALLMEIASGAFRDRVSMSAGVVPTTAGSSVSLDVEIDLIQDGRPRTVRRSIDIPVQPPLPRGSGGDWFAGDQHLHTAYSIDALFLQGTTESVTAYAETARLVGLDWIIITDHTNVGFLVWYTPPLFAAGELEALIFRNQQDYLVLQGQEMGIGAQGPLGVPAHLLVYPRAADSTGFLTNPCQGLVINHVNCEPEQVILDRVNDNGGIGFIAHPFNQNLLSYSVWDPESDAVGWAGVEIFNSELGVFAQNDEQSVEWWYELLREIETPKNGSLRERPGFPTRFPVGIGNSDAHQPALIGNTFTYCRLPGAGVSREAVLDAMVDGRCVATNGPLVYGEIGGAGTGGVAVLDDGPNTLEVTLQTTPEFGPVGDYEITILVDGVLRHVVPPSGSSDFETTIPLGNLFEEPDAFVTIHAVRDDDVFRAIANPIWLQF